MGFHSGNHLDYSFTFNLACINYHFRLTSVRGPSLKCINTPLPPRQAPKARAYMSGGTGRLTSGSLLRFRSTGICGGKGHWCQVHGRPEEFPILWPTCKIQSIFLAVKLYGAQDVQKEIKATFEIHKTLSLRPSVSLCFQPHDRLVPLLLSSFSSCCCGFVNGVKSHRI